MYVMNDRYFKKIFIMIHCCKGGNPIEDSVYALYLYFICVSCKSKTIFKYIETCRIVFVVKMSMKRQSSISEDIIYYEGIPSI